MTRRVIACTVQLTDGAGRNRKARSAETENLIGSGRGKQSY